MADFGSVERNLRDMFRLLAACRSRGQVEELAGVSIASAGSSFQMFNAAFFSRPVVDQADLDQRIALAKSQFEARGLSWSLWVCEELLAGPVRGRLLRSCQRVGLHLGSEMPAMAADEMKGGLNGNGELDIRPVLSGGLLNQFCAVGSSCFRVPLPWFQEIFDHTERLSHNMRAWIGFYKNSPVSTVATVHSGEVIGVYNLATMQPFRERGFGEAMLRHAVEETRVHCGRKPVVLQSTKQGLRLYERLGFQAVGRILVLPSR